MERFLVVADYLWLSIAVLLFFLVKSSARPFVVQAINIVGSGILLFTKLRP